MSASVMQDLFETEFFTLAKAAELLPFKIDGEPITKETLYRWCKRSPKGHRLRHGKAGGKIVVTARGILEYLTTPGGPMVPEDATPEEAEQRRQSMRAELAKLGIGQ